MINDINVWSIGLIDIHCIKCMDKDTDYVDDK